MKQTLSFSIERILASHQHRHRHHPYHNSHKPAGPTGHINIGQTTVGQTTVTTQQPDSSQQSDHRIKSKRVRTIFTPDQLERLELEFARQQYMVGPERLALAAQLSLTEAQVKVWFQNRRIKWRKQHEEETKMRLAQIGRVVGSESAAPLDDLNRRHESTTTLGGNCQSDRESNVSSPRSLFDGRRSPSSPDHCHSSVSSYGSVGTGFKTGLRPNLTKHTLISSLIFC